MSRRTSTDTLLAPRVTALTSVLPAALAGEPEAVHQVRVASRRLREVVPAFVDLGTRRGRHVSKAVRRITRAFGSARELDVALGLFDEAVATHALKPVAEAVARRALHAGRATALRAARTTITRARLARLHALLDGLTAPAAAGAEPAVTRALHARTLRAAGRLRQMVSRVTAVYAPTRLHDVRIAVKRLRYALEAGDTARGARRASRRVQQLRAVQDVLGRAHDLHVLGEFLQAVQRRVISRSRATARELDTFTQVLELECRALHAAFMSRRASLLTLAGAVAATSPAGARDAA